MHGGQFEDALNGRRAGLELEDKAIPRGVVGPLGDEVQAGGVHEREPREIEHDATETPCLALTSPSEELPFVGGAQP